MAQADSGDAGDFARHGGRLDAAARRWPDAPRPWIDLSTGINPRPWTPPPGLAVDPAQLPCPTALAALEAAAAARFGTAAHHVAAVPGSEIALRLLPALGAPRPIVAAPPCYGTHLAVADPPGDAPAGTRLIANPNNPDGRMLAPDAVLATVRPDRWTVVDEAFADALPGAGVLPHWDGTEGLVVLRSFGKFYGLAGLRLGFVVAAPAVIARVRALMGDWPVGAAAIAWGTAAYRDDAWTHATQAMLAERAARLDALLLAHELAATGACPLFRLVRDARAAGMFERLGRAGILTRPFADRRDWLRIGLPADDAAFARLGAALAGG